MAFLEIDGIGKRFGGTEVLKRNPTPPAAPTL